MGGSFLYGCSGGGLEPVDPFGCHVGLTGGYGSPWTRRNAGGAGYQHMGCPRYRGCPRPGFGCFHAFDCGLGHPASDGRSWGGYSAGKPEFCRLDGSGGRGRAWRSRGERCPI
jgi:hypothetical protein